MDQTRDEAMNDRAHGALAGLLIGDALGGLVEGLPAFRIATIFPNGVRELLDGGMWNKIAGQPTDDGEMALALSRSIVANGSYDPALARTAYRDWLLSSPFDCGNTVRRGLGGQPNPFSEANGAMMRAAPLGILCAGLGIERAFAHAAEDARLTHPNPVATTANQFYVGLVARLVRDGDPDDRLGLVRDVVAALQMHGAPKEGVEAVARIVEDALTSEPADYATNQGWVRIALHNALWHWNVAPDVETALVDTISQGGDTDTNSAICGALLGAAHGASSIPIRWREEIDGCRPDQGSRRPRPGMHWPNESARQARDLLLAGEQAPRD